MRWTHYSGPGGLTSAWWIFLFGGFLMLGTGFSHASNTDRVEVDLVLNSVGDLKKRSIPNAIDALSPLTVEINRFAPLDQIRIELVRADLLSAMGRSQEALNLLVGCRERLPAPETMDDLETRGFFHWMDGTTLLMRHLHRQAMQELSRSIELLEANGRAGDLAAVLVLAGECAAYLNEISIATRHFNDAIGIYESLGQLYTIDVVKMSLNSIASVDSERHQKTIAHVIESSRELGDLNTLASAYVTAAFDGYSENDVKIESAEFAVGLAQLVGNKQTEYAAKSALSQALVLKGDMERAWVAAEDCLELAQSMGDPYQVASAFRVCGNVGKRSDEPELQESAETAFMLARDYFSRVSDPAAVAYVDLGLGELYIRSGRPHQALVSIDASKEWLEHNAPHELKLQSLDIRAAAMKHLGQFEKALTLMESYLALQAKHWDSGLRQSLEALSTSHENELRKAQLAVAERDTRIAKSELEQRSKDLELIEATRRHEQKVHRVTRALAAVSGLVLLILGLFLWVKLRSGRLVKELNQQLEAEKEALAVEARAHLEHIRQLELVNARLKEIDEERRRILGIAAHDLRNPAGAIDTTLELLKDEVSLVKDAGAAESMGELIGLARDSVQYLLDLIEKILHARKSEMGTAHFQIRTLDPLPIVHQVIAMNAVRAEAKEIVIQTINQSDCEVQADAQGLREALDNLVSNAVKYSYPGSRISVIVRRGTDGAIRIEVHDGGPGIKPEEFSKLFVPFCKLSSKPTGGEPSTGLGLSGAKKSIEAMEGDIEVKNLPEGGACFSVVLTGSAQAALPEVKVPRPTQTSSQERLLVT